MPTRGRIRGRTRGRIRGRTRGGSRTRGRSGGRTRGGSRTRGRTRSRRGGRAIISNNGSKIVDQNMQSKADSDQVTNTYPVTKSEPVEEDKESFQYRQRDAMEYVGRTGKYAYQRSMDPMTHKVNVLITLFEEMPLVFDYKEKAFSGDTDDVEKELFNELETFFDDTTNSPEDRLNEILQKLFRKYFTFENLLTAFHEDVSKYDEEMENNGVSTIFDSIKKYEDAKIILIYLEYVLHNPR